MALQPIQTSFARGEVSPRLHGRVDLALYRIGLERCRNFLVFPQGTLIKAPGTRFINACWKEATAVRGLPFEFSTEDAYFIEAGDQYFRFYKDDGLLYVDPTDASITNGSFDTDLSGWTTSQVSWEAPGRARFASPQTNFLRQQITIAAQYSAVRHVIRYNVAEFTAGSVTLNIGTSAGASDIKSVTLQSDDLAYYATSFTPNTTSFWISFDGDTDANGYVDDVFTVSDSPLTLETPYPSADLFEIHHTQSADVMYFAHKGHPPIKLIRTNQYDWILTKIDFTGEPTEWGANKYPQRVGFYEDRLGWGATPEEPQTVWLSKTGDYENLTIPAADPTDEDALKFTISAGQVNAIQWMVEEQQLQLGTTGAARTIAGAGTDVPLTGTSIKQKRHSTYGSAAIQPVQIGAVTVYVGRFLKRLREFFYAFENDRYVSPDISILSEHLLKPGIKDFAYAQDPDSIIWCATLDGRLVGITYERDQQVNAFHDHDTDGAYESIVTIPGSNRTELWAIVRRTVNGQTRRYVELFERVFDTDLGDTIENGFFVQSGLTYDGTGQTTVLTLSATTGTVTVTAASDTFSADSVGNRIRNDGGKGIGRITAYTSPTQVTMDVEVTFDSTTVNSWTNEADIVSGLAHLEAKEVVALSDGTPFSGLTVTGGVVQLPDNRTGGIIHVGLNRTGVMRTLALAGTDDQLGTTQGRLKYISQLILRFRNTLGVSYTRAGGTKEAIIFRKTGQPMDAPPPLFTGDKLVLFDGGWNRNGQVEIVSDQPLPCEIQAIVPRMSQGVQ